jgi:hypothetical protein
MDMHSGGRTKEPPYQHIYIEAPQAEAEVIFYNRFKHNPNRVTCTCCGADYSIGDGESLEELTGFDRNCESGYILPDGRILKGKAAQEYWYSVPREERQLLAHTYFEEPRTRKYGGAYSSMNDYFKREDVLRIDAQHINPQERHGSLPRQGYFYIDEGEE